MPLHWTIDSRLQLVTAVAEGDVSKGDVEAYLAVVNGSPNIPEWRKLFDARFGRLDFSAEDVNYLGAIIRAADIVRTVGPLAFVTPESETPQLGRLLGFFAAARRPMRIFRDIARAQKWLLSTTCEASLGLHVHDHQGTLGPRATSRAKSPSVRQAQRL